jgi:hypothetical protein
MALGAFFFNNLGHGNVTVTMDSELHPGHPMLPSQQFN